MYHDPVLLKESVEGLVNDPDGIYVDVTFGGGGYSRAILERLSKGKLIAFDQDEDAISNVIEDERFMLINQNFRYLKNFLRLHEITKVSGVIADLGVSSHQFDVGERGFSTRFDGQLDMRMNKDAEISAVTIVNRYEEDQLIRIFSEYGEVHNSKKLAATIIQHRKNKEINSTEELKRTIMNCAPKRKENQYFAQVFQAIRIEVNDEIRALKELLEQCADLIEENGRLVVVSYHSLEDRLVKNFVKSGNEDGEIEKDFYGNNLVPFKAITRKPIVAGEEELERNPRSRSAKLRIAERTNFKTN